MLRAILIGLLAVATAGQVTVDRWTRDEGWRRVGPESRAMAIKKWIGTDGNLNSADNYLPSGVPINGDSLWLTSDFNGPMNTNVNTLSAVTLDVLWVQKNNRSRIGGSGSAIAVTPAKFVFEGDGDCNIEINGTQEIVLAGGANSRVIFHDDLSGNLSILSGNVWINDGSGTILNLIIGQRGYSSPNVYIDVGSDAWLGNTIVNSGNVYTDSPLGTLVVDGGVVEFVADGATDYPVVAVTVPIVVAGGTLRWNAEADIPATWKVIVSSGVLDFTGDFRAKTIDSVFVGPAGDLRTHDAITITNLTDLRPDFPILP